jgi:hypothetical protein
MSVTATGDIVSYIAAVDLVPNQLSAVALIADPKTGKQGIQVATGGQAIAGILQDKPAQGDPGAVQVRGITQAVLEPWTSAATGSLLEVAPSGNGYLQPKTTGIAVARLLGRSVGTVTNPVVIQVQLL